MGCCATPAGCSSTPRWIAPWWRSYRDKYACILSLVVTEALEPDAVRQALSIHEELVHITVEVNRHLTGRQASFTVSMASRRLER
jgi:hypothetical protein